MQGLAGETAALLPPDWEEASSTVSGTEADEAASSASGLTAAQVHPAPCTLHMLFHNTDHPCRLQTPALAALQSASPVTHIPLCPPAGPAARRAGCRGGPGAQHNAAD